MPIEFKCSSCGKRYQVKPELAGKRFKCKQCEEPVQVPKPKRRAKPAPVDDDDDFLNALADATEDESETLEMAPTRRRSKPKAIKKKRKKKKKKKRELQGDETTWFYKFSVCVGMLMFFAGIYNKITTGTRRPSLVRSFQQITSWEEFTHPNRIYSIMLPGSPKRYTVDTAGGLETHYKTLNGEVGVDVSDISYGMPGITILETEKARVLDEIRDYFKSESRFTLKKESSISLDGHPGKEFLIVVPGGSMTVRSYVTNSNIFMIQVICKGTKQSGDVGKVLNSFKIIGGSSVQKPTTAPVANAKPYLERRKTFQTTLIKKNSAPQEYINETPPPGVEEIMYQSGNLKLKAWVDKRGAKGDNAPALVYFHGGFGFGADDLEACKPFRDAGFIIMTPMLRGENGNPGNFELFYGEADDAAAACRWLADQPGVDKKRMYAFGHSAGGGISALLSLRDDVPLAHCGSAGGVYPSNLAAIFSDIAPYSPSNAEEDRLRVLVGNIHDMQRKHYAYTGDGDSILMTGMNQAIKEAGNNSKLTTQSVSGDHISSFTPALLKYLQQVQKSP